LIFLRNQTQKKQIKDTITYLDNWTVFSQRNNGLNKENNIQHPYFINAILLLSGKPKLPAKKKLPNEQPHNPTKIEFDDRTLVHTYKSRYLNGFSPDFTLFIDKENQHPMFVLLLIELTLSENLESDKHHLGQIFNYNQLVLKAQPFRTEITCIVTNLTTFRTLRTYREKGGYFKNYKITFFY